MASYYEITTPEEAWGGVSHFLGNHLLAIVMVAKDKPEHWERKISDNKAILVGYLYVLTDRMRKSGHDDVAAKIQVLLDMVVYSDLAAPGVRRAIHNKHKELDPSVAAFSAEVDRLNAEARAKRGG